MNVDDTKSLVDLLVAATLVAASLAILFALWQPEVSAARAAKGSDNPKNNKPVLAQVRGVMVWRIGPLLAIAVGTFAALTHEAVLIVDDALRCGTSCGMNDLKVLYVLNCAIVALLALGLWMQFGELWDLHTSFKDKTSKRP